MERAPAACQEMKGAARARPRQDRDALLALKHTAHQRNNGVTRDTGPPVSRPSVLRILGQFCRPRLVRPVAHRYPLEPSSSRLGSGIVVEQK
jgi:hypothetical protein